MSRKLLACVVLLCAVPCAAQVFPPVGGGGGGAPTGAAGGALGGSYPNPSIAAGASLTNPSLGAGASAISRTATAGVGGVTANLLAAKDTSDPTRRVIPASGGCGAGVAATTATVGNTFQLYASPGMVITGVADNVITAGHVLVGGTTVPGRVMDSGLTSRSAIPFGTCIVGTALQGQASVGGTVLLEYDGPGTYGTSPTFASNVTIGGTVTVNTLTPVTELTVSSTSTASPRGILSSQYTTDTLGSRLGFRKARGTEASPTVVVTGDKVGGLNAWAYDGASYLEMGSITFGVEGTVASTRTPTNIQFFTATDAAPSVLTERMRITSNGSVGIGTAAPSRSLHVNDASDAQLLLTGSSASNGSYLLATNSGSVNAIFGVRGPSGGRFSGGLAHATVIGTDTANNVQFGTANTIRGTITPGGTWGIGTGNSTATGTLDVSDKTATTGGTRVTIGLGAADSSSTVTFTNAGTTKSAGYQSSDGSAGVTGATCTGWKNGLCTTP